MDFESGELEVQIWLPQTGNYEKFGFCDKS